MPDKYLVTKEVIASPSTPEMAVFLEEVLIPLHEVAEQVLDFLIQKMPKQSNETLYVIGWMGKRLAGMMLDKSGMDEPAFIAFQELCSIRGTEWLDAQKAAGINPFHSLCTMWETICGQVAGALMAEACEGLKTRH